MADRSIVQIGEPAMPIGTLKRLGQTVDCAASAVKSHLRNTGKTRTTAMRPDRNHSAGRGGRPADRRSAVKTQFCLPVVAPHSEDQMTSAPLQPLLHDLLVCLKAPTQFWSAPSGQLTGAGAEGVYHADTRVLSRAILTVAGTLPETVMAESDGASGVRVVGLVRTVDEPGADPTVRLDRFRFVRAGCAGERIVVSCSTAEPVRAGVRIDFAADLAAMAAVKDGRTRPLVPARLEPDAHTIVWATDTVFAELVGPGATLLADDATAPALLWEVEVAPGAPVELEWHITAHDSAAMVTAAARETAEWARPRVFADDRRLTALLEQSLEDLEALRMATVDRPADTFLAAGAPWFFTLFGRDSIWAARMLLPLGTELAAGTLRTLAARQATERNPKTAEEPGKILHEVRSSRVTSRGDSSGLPPLYYGTVDATPLWIVLLHEAWRWGMPEQDVVELLPNLERALQWMRDYGDPDGDGFLEYIDASGHGLANQGWKDSSDSVQWHDGRLATGPIALSEVQGYAHQAALAGAELLEAFGRGSGDAWREWAASLAQRFRASFWVDGRDGPFPAIALDRDKRAVDALTSNIGHLLGTGLLNPAESARVAELLSGPELNSGFGLRTMSTRSAGYWALRYHGGTVWPHDTAITIAGLARDGHVRAAASFIEGLLDAAPAFGHRLPELFGGDARSEVPRPTPYPAACRPQAWSAASAVAILAAVLGISADVPAGKVSVCPTAPSPVGAVRVDSFRLGSGELRLEISADGSIQRASAPAGIEVGSPFTAGSLAG